MIKSLDSNNKDRSVSPCIWVHTSTVNKSFIKCQHTGAGGGGGVSPGDTHRGQGGEAGWLFVLYRDKWYLWKRGFTVVQILSKLCMKALLGHEYYNNVYLALSIVFLSKFQSHEIVCWTNACIEWLSLNNPSIILIIPIFISTLSL